MNTHKSNHLLVTGISYLDCAMKFEKRVQQLPMVETANLNTITGELDIVGEVRMAAIQEIGDDEGYRIRELEEGESMLNFKHDHDHDDEETFDFDGEIVLADPLGIDTRLYEIIKDRVSQNL